jgi:hypothetical protein
LLLTLRQALLTPYHRRFQIFMDGKPALQIMSIERGFGKALVVPHYIPRPERVRLRNGRDALEPHRFHQTITQCRVHPFEPALGLWRASADDRDIGHLESPAKVRQAIVHCGGFDPSPPFRMWG